MYFVLVLFLIILCLAIIPTIVSKVLVLIFILGLIALGLWARQQQKKKDFVKLKAQKASEAMTPAQKVEHERKQEQEKKYFSGKCVGGLPDIASPIAKTNTEVNDSELVIYPVTPANALGPVAGRIPVPSITNVVVEDASTVQKRITATRLLTVGVFAFAAKKKEVHSQFYVAISWGEGKIGNETIFEFEGEHAQANANQLRNIIAKRVNALPTQLRAFPQL